MVVPVRKTPIHMSLALLIILAALVVLPPAATSSSNEQDDAGYAGGYMDATDVQRIGHALDTAATRSPVQWENPVSGYQYSLMVFATGRTTEGMIRRFSILAIQPSGEAELLDLVGRSSTRNIWRIVAESPPSPVGKAARMVLETTPVPAAKISSGNAFKGFVIKG